MGILRKLIKSGIGHVGNYIGNMANAATGGSAGLLGKWVLDKAHSNAGKIGKIAKSFGQAVLSKETRNKLSKGADEIISYLPGGKIKETLKKINNSAQGRNESNNNYKSSKSSIAGGEGNSYNVNTQPIVRGGIAVNRGD